MDSIGFTMLVRHRLEAMEEADHETQNTRETHVRQRTYSSNKHSAKRVNQVAVPDVRFPPRRSPTFLNRVMVGWHPHTRHHTHVNYLMNTGLPSTCKFMRKDVIFVGTKPCASCISILVPPSNDFTKLPSSIYRKARTSTERYRHQHEYVQIKAK